ncbi:hypothetical protein ANN_14217 [Periplaneta americana]|uniref:Uncharacterized protein n=1 Tax=Periplaneta americana TaxID=6978 RepID=A0ABQ8SWA2_PERAM|nr:hypothetical protein ANN_14217 [Periplaneta americana]
MAASHIHTRLAAVCGEAAPSGRAMFQTSKAARPVMQKAKALVVQQLKWKQARSPRRKEWQSGLFFTAPIYFRRIQQRRHGKSGCDVLLKHDNGSPHGSRHALEHTVLPHPSYSPDIAPSDHAVFDTIKEVMRVKKFTSNDDHQAVVQQ